MAVNSRYTPPGNYKPNSHVQNEIKSHSSVLFNERLHVLMYMLETKAIEIHTNPKLKSITEVNSILHQMWKILRTIIFNDPLCRKILNLETNIPGVYTPDIGFNEIRKKIIFLNQNTHYITLETLNEIMYEMDETEMIMRNILQFYKYFIRFERRQKPDIDVASERYRLMMDEATKKELQEVMGKSAKFNLDDLDQKIDEDYFKNLGEDEDEN